jgi:hypothetical protein
MVQSSRETEGQSSAEEQGSQSQGTMSRMADNVSHLANVDEQKTRAASALRDVASTLRERATSAPLPGMDSAVEAAARPLESGAAYLEEHTPGDMWSDLMAYCRDHPAGALFIGFGVGYAFKKLFR